MKLNHLLTLALVLTFAPGFALAMNGNGTGAGQQLQPHSPAVESSHALLTNTIDQTGQTTTAAQSSLAPRDLFQNCGRLVSQARDQAHALVDSATHPSFNPDLTARRHKELKESLGNLKQEHERFYSGLTQEQQSSVQMRNANLLQAQDRLQNLVKDMERELSDSTLHSSDVAEQARATQREMKSYQKEFRAMGKNLSFATN
jgi:hypothetical protein